MGWIITFLILAFIIKTGTKNKPVQKSKRTSNQLDAYSNRNKNSVYQIKITSNYSSDRESYSSNSNYGSRTTNELIWVGEEDLTIDSYVIKNAMTYYNNSQYRVETPACIPNKLSIGREVYEEKGTLGYWPSYSEITPNQRANYLNWMQKGRRTELNDVGYIFIFFYGLEYRLLIQKKDKEIILKETRRLLDLYGHLSGSLTGYFGNFIFFNTIKDNINNLSLDTIKSFETIASLEKYNAVKLAWFYLKNIPLTAEEAISVVKDNNESNSKSIVVKRIPELLEKLFIHKYNQKYPEGMLLKVAKRDFDFNYHSASSGLYNEYIKMPNVLGINSQFSYCVKIWNESIEELKKASTVFYKGNSIDSMAVYSELPEQLKEIRQHPLTKEVSNLIESAENMEIYKIIGISDMAKILEMDNSVDKLTLNQSKEISILCKDFGYLVEPDANITNKVYKVDDKIALFKVNGPESLSSYNIYSLILELGVAVANADGNIDKKEIDHIMNLLEDNFALSSHEKIRINALKNVLVRQTPSINGLGKRLKSSLDENKIKTVAEFVVGISAIDGNIDKTEIKAMKTLFKAMELETNFLEELITKFQPSRNMPIEIISKSRNEDLGETIPSLIEVPENIQLDHDKIQAILFNTKEIAGILNEIFEEEEVEKPIEKPAVAGLPLINVKFDGLDSRYHELLNEILGKKEWEFKHFEELAKKYNQMPAGTLDVINEWADDMLGDFLIIDEGQNLIVNTELIEEM